jgi:predicted nucleic acid-binding protein
MKVVIDTNILLISLPSLSPYHEIIKAFNRKVFELIITTNNIIGSFLQASNSIFVNNYFHWDLITIDADDNKFTDAYISGNADYLITHDSHFNVLKRKKFPKSERYYRR